MKFSNGALVCYSVSPDFQPKTPAQLQAIAQDHGVPDSICPNYAGDRVMVTRAITSNTASAKAGGWLVQSLETNAQRVIYTIARIEKDKVLERTDFTHETTIKWSSEGGNGAHIEGSHEVARKMDATYQELRGMVQSGDWTKNLIDYVTGPCQGVALKNNGHVWWVPPQGSSKITALRSMLADVGIALFVSEIDAENVRDVAQVAQRGLTEQIQDLMDEVNGVGAYAPPGFDGSQAPSVYRSRLETLRQIREKGLAYHDAVGINLQQLKDMLGQVDAKVRGLLSVRLETVIHKDGTRERVGRPPVAEQIAQFTSLVAGSDTDLARALIDGRLVVDCDDGDIAQLRADGADETPGLDPDLAQLLAEPSTPSDIPDTF